MSTFKSSIATLPYPQDKFLQPSVQGALPSVRMRVWQDAVTRRQPEPFTRRFGSFFRECWRRMRVMKAAFEQSESGDGTQSRERREERLRDEESWSRMDDEGCPNARQQPYTSQRRSSLRLFMHHPLGTLLYELFVLPPPRQLLQRALRRNRRTPTVLPTSERRRRQRRLTKSLSPQ